MNIWEANAAGELPQGPTDFFYRSLVPKDPVSNMRFRKQMLEMCYKDPVARADVWRMCSRDILFYIGSFGWTYNPRSKPPLIPMIPFDYQEPVLKEISANLGVRDITVPKSRDMGASWCCLLPMEHAWHFQDMLQFLLTSEKEELVYGKSHKALFSKLKFWWKHLPAFLRPDMDATRMNVRNKDNDSAFDGEATVAHLGTGDRRTAFLLDEASKMRNAREIRTSTRDVTDCRIFNSTPLGREGIGKAFYEQCRNEHTLRLFMHWSEHPTKRQGLYRLNDDLSRTRLDEETYDWKDDYDFDALTFKQGRKPRSTWYDLQCERENHDPVSIAQELDIDFVGSAERLLSAETIAYIRNELIQPPLLEGVVIADPLDYEMTFVEQRNGPVKLWVPLVTHKNADGTELQVPPAGSFSAGVDIASGRATKNSSESAIEMFNRATGEQVLEYCAHNIGPEDWGVIAVALCKWFHDAFMVPENNGAINLQFMDEVRRSGYWNVYRMRYTTVGFAEQKKVAGYYSTDAGQKILGRMCADILRKKCKIRSDKVLHQLQEYELRGAGKLVHAGSMGGNAAGQGKLHGDAAIAAALAHEGVLDRPASEEKRAESTPVALPGSMAWRMKQVDEADALLASGSLCVW